MHRVEVHSDAVVLQHAHELIRDLHSDALLNSEAPREHPHQAGQLGDADDLFVRDVGDEGVAVERQRVVLAKRVELDWPLDDLADVAVRSAVALSGKRGQELGVAFITRGSLVERSQIAGWGLARARRVKVHAKRLEDLGGVALELLPLLGADMAWVRLLPMRGLLWIERESRHVILLVTVVANNLLARVTRSLGTCSTDRDGPAPPADASPGSRHDR